MRDRLMRYEKHAVLTRKSEGRETVWKMSVFSVFVSPPRNVHRKDLYKMFRRNDVALKAAPGRDHISRILFRVKTNNDFWTRPIYYPYYIDCTFVCLVHVFRPASADLYYFSAFVRIPLLSLLLIIVIIVTLSAGIRTSPPARIVYTRSIRRVSDGPSAM